MAKLKGKIKVQRRRYEFEGWDLAEAREQSGGVSQEQFAQKIGWSHQYQSKLEAPGKHIITADVLARINAALKSFCNS